MDDWKTIAVDVAGLLIMLYAAACRLASQLLTVYCDPLGRSGAGIGLAVRARGAASFRVLDAPTEYERRVVAWFYRQHDAPTADDWRGCLARFGLGAGRVPPHVIRLDTGQVIFVDAIDLSNDTYVVSLAAKSDPPPARIPIGGLSPERLIKAALTA